MDVGEMGVREGDVKKIGQVFIFVAQSRKEEGGGGQERDQVINNLVL